MTIHETETNDIKLLPSTTVLKRMLSSGIDEKDNVILCIIGIYRYVRTLLQN